MAYLSESLRAREDLTLFVSVAIGEQRQVTCAFNGTTELALITGTGAGNPTWY
ncbi:MAG: hypothetical protein ACI9W2_005270, partial [Gammaproteobacteria bacterium]